MRYYVATDKLFIDIFRARMQKMGKESQKLVELWKFEKVFHSAQKLSPHENTRHSAKTKHFFTFIIEFKNNALNFAK